MLSPGKDLLLLQQLSMIEQLKVSVLLRCKMGRGQFTKGGFTIPVTLTDDAKKQIEELDECAAQVRKQFDAFPR